MPDCGALREARQEQRGGARTPPRLRELHAPPMTTNSWGKFGRPAGVPCVVRRDRDRGASCSTRFEQRRDSAPNGTTR